MTHKTQRLTKSELVKRLSEDLDISAKESRYIMDTFLGLITEGLQKERKILISDFGSFQVSIRESFEGYNPHSGDSVQVPRRLLPIFKSGKSLKSRLNPSEPNTDES